MPNRRPVAFFDLSVEEMSDENLDSTVEGILADLSQRKIAKHDGPGPHPGTGTPQTVHAPESGPVAENAEGQGSFIDPSAPSAHDQTDILDGNAETLSQVTVFPRPGIDDNPAIVATATTMFERALANEAEISPVLLEVAAQTQGELIGYQHRVKHEAAIRDKLFRIMGEATAAEEAITWEEAARRNRDYNRYTLVWQADDQWAAKHAQTMEALKARGWDIYDHKDKNGWGAGDHYNGMNYQLTNGEDFMEIQFHTPESHAIKDVSHALYSQARILAPDDPTRVQMVNQIWDLWNGDLTHVPPGVEGIGTPTNFLMKRQIVNPQAASFQFYVRTDDEGTPIILFRTDGLTCEAFGTQTGQWHPVLTTLPELAGLGGSSDYLPVSDRGAMDYIMGALGQAPRDIRAKGRPTKLAKHAQHNQEDHGNWADGSITDEGLRFTKEQWQPGEKAWFEYHCLESCDSGDAPAWYRSHQQVTILGEAQHEGTFGNIQERMDAGMPKVYTVQFEDGLEWDVFEDELMTSREGFYRPDPPPDPDIAKRILKADFAPTITVVDSDNPQNLIFGWANVAFTADGNQVTDHQGHMIDVEDLEHMAYNFVVKYRKSGDMHRSDAFGELVESMVYTPEKLDVLGLSQGSLPYAWWVGFRLPPEEAEKVRTGQRSMLSIEGGARLELADD